jgi:hypothetical protein
VGALVGRHYPLWVIPLALMLVASLRGSGWPTRARASMGFAAIGWSWGGYWTAPDYQHFSTNGH